MPPTTPTTAAPLLTEFKVDRKRRQITGYASTFGNVDLGDDVVERGAYARTLAEDLPAGCVKVLRDHREDRLIGKPLHAEQDSRGLLTVSYIGNTPLGDETLALVQDGILDGMSIGYVTRKSRQDTRGGRRVRVLEDVRLLEWSFVTQPMNEEARVTGVKMRLPATLDTEDAGDAGVLLRELRDALRPAPAAPMTNAEALACFRGLSASLRTLTRGRR